MSCYATPSSPRSPTHPTSKNGGHNSKPGPVTTMLGLVCTTVASLSIAYTLLGKSICNTTFFSIQQQNKQPQNNAIYYGGEVSFRPVDSYDDQEEREEDYYLDDVELCPAIAHVVGCPSQRNQSGMARMGPRSILPCSECVDRIHGGGHVSWIDTFTVPPMLMVKNRTETLDPFETVDPFDIKNLFDPFDNDLNDIHALQKEEQQAKIHMSILSPRGYGSHVLETILSSSPAVSRGVGNNSNKPIIMDQHFAIGNVKSLLEYYTSQNIADYRVLVLWRHPCRKNWSKKKRRYLLDILNDIPFDNRFLVDYDELILRPHVVLPRLLLWFPSLESVRLDTVTQWMDEEEEDEDDDEDDFNGNTDDYGNNENKWNEEEGSEELLPSKKKFKNNKKKKKLHGSGSSFKKNKARHGHRQLQRQQNFLRLLGEDGGMDAGSMESFVFSNQCQLQTSSKYVSGEDVDLWNRFVAEMRAQV